MFRFIAGRSLSKIFDLPEERANLVLTKVRTTDQLSRIDRLVYRDSEPQNLQDFLQQLKAEWKLPSLEMIGAAEFNSMPVSQSEWLVMLADHDSEGHNTKLAFLLARWAPGEAEDFRKFAKLDPEAFLVFTPMVFRDATDEEMAQPPPKKVQEAMKEWAVQAAGRRKIEVKEEPDPWFQEAIK